MSVLHRVDEEFRDGRTVVSVPPTRFYLNLTERCSLRCAHCITAAPARTADGTARDMSMDVVEALRPHLRHAAYVGFVHAGEPLMAPALEPVLRALREQRAGEPTVVHTLTNGVALGTEKFDALVDLGVTSFSISLDGMSAATQDAIRIGSRAGTLLGRIEALAARRPEGVRLGIAWTVMASNIDEIPALLRFASAAGVDWVKLEEVYPVNELSTRESLIPPGRLHEAVHRALALANELGLPLLEHVFEKTVWKCALAAGSSVERFSRLDDFANRMEINSCRLPWELCCVEPDGDVKPMTFHHPVAGNLLAQDLSRTWNARGFVEERLRSVERRVCRGGAVTCGVDPGPASW